MSRDVILCDVEGTTTSLSFVQEVLFPLSFERMEDFLREHWSDTTLRDEIQAVSKSDGVNDAAAMARVLREWIREDRKDWALKSIQGKIWKEAFESGAIRGHVYPDVPPNFRKWNADRIRICIFSSGSVQAQQLLFRHSEAGDLTKYLHAYFDTSTCPKKEPGSYTKIAAELGPPPSRILFLSDIEAELDAARSAGMQTTQIVRDNRTQPSAKHPTAPDFDGL